MHLDFFSQRDPIEDPSGEKLLEAEGEAAKIFSVTFKCSESIDVVAIEDRKSTLPLLYSSLRSKHHSRS